MSLNVKLSITFPQVAATGVTGELRPNHQKIRSIWWSFAACMERMEYFVLSFFFELKHLMYSVRPVIAVAYNCWSNCRRKLVFLPKRMAGSWLANLTARLLTWSWQQVGKYCLVRRFKCTIENSSWPGCSLCDQRYVYIYHKFPDFSTYRIT